MTGLSSHFACGKRNLYRPAHYAGIARSYFTGILVVLLATQRTHADTLTSPLATTLDDCGLSRLVSHPGGNVAERSVTPKLLQVGNGPAFYAVDLYGDGLLWFSLDHASVIRSADLAGNIHAMPLASVSRMLSELNTGAYVSATKISSAEGAINILAASAAGEVTEDPSSTAAALEVDSHGFTNDSKRNTRRLKGQVLVAKIGSVMQQLHARQKRHGELPLAPSSAAKDLLQTGSKH